MSEPTLELFRHVKETESFAQGQTIFREGQSAEAMYVVIEGEVDIMVHDKIVSAVGPGGIVGEMALIDKKARSATALAKIDCRLARIDEKRFHFLVQQTPYFALSVMRVVTERLRRKDVLV